MSGRGARGSNSSSPHAVQPRHPPWDADLENLDPHVGHGHGQLVVKPKAALALRPAQRGHTRDLLGDGNAAGQDLVQKPIRKHHVHAGIVVHAPVKVVGIPA